MNGHSAGIFNPLYKSRRAIERHQHETLRALIQASLDSNQYFGPRLREADVDASIPDFKSFYSKCPLTSKAELVADQEVNPPYGTNLTEPLEQYTRFHQTSGTTGKPLRWMDTPRNWEGLVANWMEVYQAAGVTAADRVYFAFSFGPFIGFWLAFDAAEQIGCMCLPGGGLSTNARLKAISENRATIICCTPTYAQHLAGAFKDLGIDPSQLAVRKLIVAGEPGGSIPESRRYLESMWPGVNMFDHHGMTEVGPVSYECPRYPGNLRIIESGYLAEIIDPDTRKHVERGQTGELVLTTLNRVDSPLFRYRTGDLVKEMVPISADGDPQNMILEGGILGRADDMVVVRGVNIHPSAIEAVVRRVPNIVEYQVEVSRLQAMTELSVKIEVSDENGAAAVDHLGKELQVTFNLRIPVRLAEAGSLPRFEMKSKRWVSLGE
jgi:phenylacetate-CoA ligase